MVITIQGTNDAPFITSQAQAGTVTEDIVLSVTGQVTASDVDHGAHATFTGNAADTYGTFTVDPDTGVWSYALDNANHQDLAEGETHTATFTVTVTDDHGAAATQNVVITIQGTNDAPTGAATATLQLGTEDMIYVVSVADLLQGFNDIDDMTLTVSSLVADHGSVLDNGDGTFTITPAANYNGPVQLSYTVSDPHNASVGGTQSFTLAAVADLNAQDDSSSGDEDTAIIASVANNDSTTSGGSLSYALADGPAHGAVTFNSDGTYAYNPDANYFGSDSFTYTVTDTAAGESATRTVSLTINPVNDSAIITGQVSGDITEDAVPNTVTGNLDAADVDNAPDSWTAVSSPQVAANGYGSYTINAAGQWTYQLANGNPAVNALPGGTVVTDSFTVTTIDGTPQLVTITITGANDGAIISGTKTGNVVEAGGVNNAAAGTPTTGGTLTITDPDTGEATFVTPLSPLNSTYGTFAFNASTGVWGYTLDNSRGATQQLVAGQIVTDTMVIQSLDGTATTNVVVTITGANDAATITGLHDGTVTEATSSNPGVPTAAGDLNSFDVDGAADAWTVTGSTLTASGYGSYAIDATGHWTYALNNANPVVDALASGASLNDSFTVTTADGTAQVVNIVINGQNDVVVPAPNDLVLTMDASQFGSNEPNGSFGQLSVANAVSGATYTYAATSLTATLLNGGPASGFAGDFTVSSSGAISAQGVDTGRIYELTVQVTQGANSYSESFSIIIGTNNTNDSIGLSGATLAAATGDDVIFGLGQDDTIFAGSGNDVVYGQQANDQIHGGTGNDTLYGGFGSDRFYFDTPLDALTNVDRIMDLEANGNDKIVLDDTIFTAFGSGAERSMSASSFIANAGGIAGSATNYVLFDTATGNLYYDADGNGAAARVLVAHIDLASGTLDASDFLIA